ncbi:MAG: hypothetical protein MZV70_42165 [Desulfobacterales bacterium]|nr:hypothetical protein [Desulfobacterales bacterium]
MITGYASLEIAIDAMKCGASDFISKPVQGKPDPAAAQQGEAGKLLLEENRKFSDTSAAPPPHRQPRRPARR